MLPHTPRSEVSPPFYIRWKRALGDLRRRLRILMHLAHQARNPAHFPKYLPADPESESYSLTYCPPVEGAPLPVPPRELWLGYSDEAKGYLESGRDHVGRMLELAPLPSSTSATAPGGRPRLLDLGCGGGRMIRHLQDHSGTHEIWGVDISAAHINWLKTHLSPPFHFATTTTIPHLPFADGWFDFIYCGSLFTHIEDLAEAWFLEVARVLAPGGTFYCTVHDEHTARLVVRDGNPLARVINHNPDLAGDVVVVGRDANANVFYKSAYLRNVLAPLFEILRVEQEAYGYQTAWVLRRR